MRNLVAGFLLAFILSNVVIAGPILWVGDNSGTLGTVDVDTGNVNVIGSMGVTMTDIAFDPSGNLYGVTFSALYSINKVTGSTTQIGSLGGASVNSLVFDSAGNLYAANNSLYTINVATGAATVVGTGGSYSSSGDLAFIGGELFLSSVGDSLFKLDTLTGIGTLVGAIGSSAVYGLATDNNIDLYGLTSTTVLSINTATGAGSALVNYGGQGLNAAWGSAFLSEAGGGTIPEPATLALLSLGLVGIGFARKKKQS